MPDAAPVVSIAIPVYNEEAVIPELVRRTKTVLDELDGGPHELVLVDDGSSDSTPRLLAGAAEADPRIVVVTLSRNFGHGAAITAGLDHARGDAVVLMDGDLQDSPESIPLLLAKMREGYDVVYATRVKRKEAWWLRACFSAFYRIFAALSETPIPLDAGAFAVVSRRVLDEIQRLPERNRYLPGLRSWAGFRQTGVIVERGRRSTGQSVGVRRLIKLALDAVFAFSIVPIRAVAFTGAATILASACYSLFILYARLTWNQPPRGFTTLILAITFFAGIQLVFLGIIGEYVGRVYEEVKRRPQYVVAARMNFPLAEPKPVKDASPEWPSTHPGHELGQSHP